MYSVTENILEHDAVATPVGNSIPPADQPIDQSPFLPEVENNETLLSILHGGHDIDVHNETDDLKSKYESDDANANLIEGPISVQKIVPLQAVSSTTENLPKSSTTNEALETSLNETHSDSTEVYNLQESRSHNIEKGIAAETENENVTTENVDSSTELAEENNTRSISLSTTDANADMDSTEKQTELDSIPATEPVSEPSSEPSPSSSTTDVNAEGTSTEKLLKAEQTETDIIPATEPASEPSPSSSLEPSTEPASEPVPEKSTESSIVLNTSEASQPEEQSSSSIAPSTSSENPVESSSQSTPSSSTTELPVVDVRQISSSEGPTSTEVDATDASLEQTTFDSAESLESSSSKEERSSSTESSPSSSEPTTIERESDTELKVIPLPSSTTTAEDPPPEKSTTSNETNTASEESTETTTGHFLSKATFHLNSSDSLGTSEPSDKTQTPETMTTTTTVAVPIERSNFNYSRCTAGQFECQNGTSIKDGSACINQNERCDSIFQCSDRSDETDCELLGCPGHFQCNDGACLARSLVCDSVVHCRDGSDETEDLCKSWQCKFDEIACGPMGPCLPSIQQCDGIQNCANQADEANCPEKTCGSSQFYCSWQRKCIPETWVCDGKIDCLGGGEDERLCDCQPDEFKCNSGGCVSVEYVCDGQPQCPDLSDEFNCFNLTETDTIESINTALQVKRYNNQFAFVCAENFTQANAKAICNELGFAGVSEWSNHSLLTNEVNLVRITSGDESSFLANLNSTNKCENDLVIALECEQFCK